MLHSRTALSPAPLALVASLLIAHGTAAAQQTYTFKALSKPAGSYSNSCRASSIDANGVVLGSCEYWTGRIYFPGGYPQYETRGRVVSWSPTTGSSNALTYPSNASVRSVLGRGPKGAIYASLRNLPTKGGDILGIYTLTGSTWAKWVPPSPLTGNWSIAHINPVGMLLLSASEAGRAGQLAVVKDSVVTVLPTMPAVAEGYMVASAMVGSDGHVVVRAKRSADIGGSDGRRFWWNGTQWQERQAPDLRPRPPGILSYDHASVRSLGLDKAFVTILEGSSLGVYADQSNQYVWDLKTDGLQQLPAGLLDMAVGGVINDSGSAIFTRQLPGADSFYPEAYRAMVLVNGQAVELGSLATLPSGVAVNWPVAMNNKGQVLLHTTGTNWTFGVMTPK